MKYKSVVLLLMFLVIVFSCSNNQSFIDSIPKVSRDSLVLYLKFDENIVVDESEFQNACSVFGTMSTNDRFNIINSALYFDGIDDYLVIKDIDQLTPAYQNLTISLWFKTNFPGNKFLLYKGSSHYNREYAVGIRIDSLASFQINQDGNSLDRSGVPSQTKLEEDLWYHLVCIWDGNIQKIYLNSKLDNLLESNLIIKNHDSDLYIGSYGGSISQYAFHGAIDDLLIFNRVLDEEEIQLIYNDKIE